MINIAVVGLGHWGPNLVRNLASVPHANLYAVCDLDAARAETVRERFSPASKVMNHYQQVADDPNVSAVAIATPIRSHFELGQLFLSAGKHVFMEKPLAYTAAECQQLIDLAERQQRVLMVGHVFLYNAIVQRIKQCLDAGEIGDVFYVYAQRVNLGRIQQDVNALWSFAPHDISIMNYWLGSEPSRVSARGFCYLNDGVEDVVFVTLEYPGGIGCHLHLGWLDPRKIRLTTIVGSKKMLVYDDVSLDAKLQIYDKGIADLDAYRKSPDSFAEFQFRIRTGDLLVPTMQFGEPLFAECKHFVECIETGRQPVTDGRNGLQVVRVLEAAERSLRQNGQQIEIA